MSGRLVEPAEPVHTCPFPFLDERGMVQEGEGGPGLGTVWCCHACGRWWGVVAGYAGPVAVRLRWWTRPRLWRRAVRG